MTAREEIIAGIEKLDEKRLQELLLYVREIASRPPRTGGGLMEGLRKIKIQGPVDFSENFDLYASGEKRVEDNLH